MEVKVDLWLDYREEARGSAAVGGGDISRGGHFKSSRHHNSYHHESHGSGGHSGKLLSKTSCLKTETWRFLESARIHK